MSCWRNGRTKDSSSVANAKTEVAGITKRLDDVVDDARLQVMSEARVAEGVCMVKEEFPDIWRLSLRPDDYADVPPLEMEMKDPDQSMSKPYTKRYTKR